MKRALLIALALLAGGLLLWKQRHEAATATRDLAQLLRQCGAISNQIAVAEARTPDLRRALALAAADRSQSLADLVRLGRAEPSPSEDPESRWNRPPETLPDWNPESPYVWLDKSILPKLQVSAFQSDGTLSPGVGEVLTLGPQEQDALNRQLTAVVAEYRREELAHARLVEDHLPEIAQKEGKKLTLHIEPMPDITTTLRGRFEEALTQSLGAQRAGILSQSAVGWISEMFPATQENPRIVSIAVDSNGEHHVAMRNGVGTMSASGPGDYIEYVPLHLRPLLDEFRETLGHAATK